MRSALVLVTILVSFMFPSSSLQAQDDLTLEILAPHEVDFGRFFALELRVTMPVGTVLDDLDLEQFKPLEVVAVTKSLGVSAREGMMVEVLAMRARAWSLDRVELPPLRFGGLVEGRRIEGQSRALSLAVRSALPGDDSGKAEAPEGPFELPPRGLDRRLLCLAMGLGISCCAALWLVRDRLRLASSSRPRASPFEEFEQKMQQAPGPDFAARASLAFRELLRDLDLVAASPLDIESCLDADLAGRGLGDEDQRNLASHLHRLELLAYSGAAIETDEEAVITSSLGEVARRLTEVSAEEPAP